MLINEINTLSNFNIVLFYINCIMSYKIDQFIYIIKFHNYPTLTLNNKKNINEFIFLNSLNSNNKLTLERKNELNEKNKQAFLYYDIIKELCLGNINIDINEKIKNSNEEILSEMFLIPGKVNFHKNITNTIEIKINPYIYMLPDINSLSG